MQNHTKIYLEKAGYDETSFVPCELCGKKAIDIHHIIGRGKGGKNTIENLMALCREEHIKFGDKKQFMYMLLTNHKNFLSRRKVEFNWYDVNSLIEKYEN